MGQDSVVLATTQCEGAVRGPAVKATLPRSIRVCKGRHETVRLVNDVNRMEAGC